MPSIIMCRITLMLFCHIYTGKRTHRTKKQPTLVERAKKGGLVPVGKCCDRDGGSSELPRP